jgi:hypothetical protein
MVKYFTLITLTLTVKLITSIEKECPEWKCGGTGICVQNSSLCPSPMTCPDILIKINQFTCGANDYREDNTNCPNYTCWDDTCVDDPNLCPSMTTCPNSNPIRCADNSCVQNIDDCPNYIECPLFIPVRCPNGDCRKSLKDCPSNPQCPKDFGVRCNDGSCRMTGDKCEGATNQTQCTDKTMTRCSDGTCTTSKFLCPTPKSCPDNLVLCWDGICVNDFSQCRPPLSGQSDSCSNPVLVRCEMDGSCRANINDCPASTICSVEKPVKCWDNSCKETIDKCPKYQNCPEGTISCQDGTCTNTTCGTHITCSLEAPYKCFDNTCRKNPLDCPTKKDCPNKTPIYCWDGTCVATRAECLAPDRCPATESVRCPDNMCRKTVNDCRFITDCPLGFVLCPNGVCKKNSDDCEADACPLNFPYQCKNGLCVKSPDSCEKENGCPFYLPIKCRDGGCVSSQLVCNGVNPQCTAEDTQLCPDGSCLPITMQCPLENGCPAEQPLKCSNGNCIDPTVEECPIPKCPQETPIKCLNGLCAISSSNCQSTYDLTGSMACGDMILCSDGTCANSPEECRPTFACPMGYERCDDGSCRLFAEFCPKIKTCPIDRPTRCSDGSCAISPDICLNNSGCPKNFYKCPYTGLCVNTPDRCKSYEANFDKSNGCSKNTPIKCPSGKCVDEISKCTENLCKGADEFPCPNTGKCVTNIRQCSSTECDKGFVTCIDGTCKEKIEDCVNNITKCPISKPFRCLNGSCQRYPFIYTMRGQNEKIKSESPNTNELALDLYCNLGIQCPNYKPFLCADGSCEKKSNFCKSFIDCPVDTPYRCIDRTCVAFAEQCKEKLRCPPRNPILCPITGNCVDNYFDCFKFICPKSTPIQCANGKCVNSPRDCVINTVAQEPLCPKGNAVCYDGSCRTSIDLCPIYPGCTDPKLPYKCKDGSCVGSKSECVTISITCEKGLSLCEDGLCRSTCPAFFGCPNETPLQCPSGRCVNEFSECAGESNCPLDTPFKCFDGSCVSTTGACKSTKRGFGADVNLFIYPEVDMKADLVITDTNDVVASIRIPSNVFSRNITNFNIETGSNEFIVRRSTARLNVKALPTSMIRNTKSLYHITRQEEVNQVYPFGDSNNDFTLEYEYAVLSPAIEITLDDIYIFNSDLILGLAYDFPAISGANILDPLLDVCIGKLNTTSHTWQCLNVTRTTQFTVNYQLFANINSTGVYAVIFSPLEDNTEVAQVPNFFFEYMFIILGSAAGFILFVILGLYIFWRIYRFRGKYKESREESKKFESKMQEMTFMGSNYHLGQSLGDTLDKVVYTNNPCYKVSQEEGKSKRVEELENLQESMLRRYKQLERNNDELRRRFDTISGEVHRLRGYKEEIVKNTENNNTNNE